MIGCPSRKIEEGGGGGERRKERETDRTIGTPLLLCFHTEIMIDALEHDERELLSIRQREDPVHRAPARRDRETCTTTTKNIILQRTIRKTRS